MIKPDMFALAISDFSSQFFSLLTVVCTTRSPPRHMSTMPDTPFVSDPQPPLPRFPIDLGWCPHQVEQLEKDFDDDILSYLCRLDRPSVQHISHEMCREKASEGKRDKDAIEVKCKAFQIHGKGYKTKHTTTNCKCEFIHVDGEKMANIISNGKIPLVSIQEHKNGDVSLNVEAHSFRSRYTAISHIWSDGLGNKSHNALPKCQLQRLNAQLKDMPRAKKNSRHRITPWTYVDWRRQSYSMDASPPPLFWIDTLCIPVGPQGSKEDMLRRICLSKMALIYTSPVQVLVLDAELQMCSTRDREAQELLARILCSCWMRRAWTLDEGVLAREIVFQFKDIAIDPLESWSLIGDDPEFSTDIRFPKSEQDCKIYKALFASLSNRLHHHWKNVLTPDRYASKSYKSARKKKSPNESNEYCRVVKVSPWFDLSKEEEIYRMDQLVDTWNELTFRSTTRSEDIPVILANLLDFKCDEMPKRNTVEDVIESMLLSFDTLSVSLLYSTGKRRDRGSEIHRWIPVELGKSYLKRSPTMSVLFDRMCIEIGGETNSSIGPHAILLQDVSLEQEGFQVVDPLTQKRHTVTLHGNHEEKAPLNYCMVLEDPLPGNDDELTRGALFTVNNHPQVLAGEPRELWVSFVCPLEVSSILGVRDTLESGFKVIDHIHHLRSTRIYILYGKCFGCLWTPTIRLRCYFSKEGGGDQMANI